MGKIYIMLGKSATGKDTIYQAVQKQLKDRVRTIVTYTTRPIRDSEIEGREYHFVGEEQYKKLKEEHKVIEERAYHTMHGLWRYFTANDGQIDLSKDSYLMIGTIEAYVQIRDYIGQENVVPIYIEVETGTRLTRALEREKRQSEPKYVEMCRRFLADEEDFSEEKLQMAGIEKIYENVDLDLCIEQITKDIYEQLISVN